VLVVGGDNFDNQQGRIEDHSFRLTEWTLQNQNIGYAIARFCDPRMALRTDGNLQSFFESREVDDQNLL
jgi:hypothetical protein